MEAKQNFVVAYCSHEDKILIVHKNRPAHLAGRINLPGGKIEPGEMPIPAAVRELKEEAGLDARDRGIEVGRIEANGFVIHVIKILVDKTDPILPQEGETELVEWKDWSELIREPRLMPNLRIIIPLLLAGVHGWVIGDDASSRGKVQHKVNLEIPTYLEVTT